MKHCAAPDGHFSALPTILAVNLIALTALAVGANPIRELHLRPVLLGLAIRDRPPLARPGIVRPGSP
eukprot:13885501-Alexandrium_andersonii.AAC.1